MEKAEGEKGFWDTGWHWIVIVPIVIVGIPALGELLMLLWSAFGFILTHACGALYWAWDQNAPGLVAGLVRAYSVGILAVVVGSLVSVIAASGPPY